MSIDPPAENAIDAAIQRIDESGDESAFRAAIAAARTAVMTQSEARSSSLDLAAAWSKALRHSVNAAARLSTGGDNPGWTWYVSGSVARGEAAPGSDVETMLVLDDSVDADGKTAIMGLAADVHALLERGGVGGDANGVLASRGRFCRRLSSWSEGIQRWCAEPREDRGVVMTGLVADSTGVQHPSVLAADALRSIAVAAAGRHYAVRQAMLQDATAVRADFPSRLRIFATHDDTVNLKLAAVDPVVKIARWASLSAHSDALSTLDRLDAASAGQVLDAEDASTLHDCFIWLQRLRWHSRAAAWHDGERISDTISLSALAPQDRAALRNVAREIAGIRRKLVFLASTSSFR